MQRRSQTVVEVLYKGTTESFKRKFAPVNGSVQKNFNKMYT